MVSSTSQGRVFPRHVPDRFHNSIAPKKGDQFDFINLGGAGDFTGLTIEIEGLEPGFEYSDGFMDGRFTLTALNDGVSDTPEPSTLVLLGSGLLGMWYRVGRRRSE